MCVLQVYLSPHDNVSLLSKIMSSQHQSCVAEFAHDGQSGLWMYKCLRPDKTNGNYSDTVLDTPCGIAERLITEDLKNALCEEPRVRVH